jgi:hypothetical protein
MSNSSGYSYSELTSALKGLGLTEDSEIYKAYIREWTNANYLAEQKVFESIWGDHKELLSYGAWLKSTDIEFESEEQKKEYYRQYVLGQLQKIHDLDDKLYSAMF